MSKAYTKVGDGLYAPVVVPFNVGSALFDEAAAGVVGGEATEAEQQSQTALLTEIRDAQAGNATAYTDDTFALFYRSPSGFIDANGAPYTPAGTVTVAGAGKDVEIESTYFTALFDNTGYLAGQTIKYTGFYDTSTIPASLISDIWFNIDLQQVIPAPPSVDIRANESEDVDIAKKIRDHLPRQDDIIIVNWYAYLPADTNTVLAPLYARRRSLDISMLAVDPDNTDGRLKGHITCVGSADEFSPHAMLHGGSKCYKDATSTIYDVSVFATRFDVEFFAEEQGY